MSSMQIESINGRITKFGPEQHEGKYGRTISRVGQEVTVEYRFDWNALPTEGVNEMIHTIPSGSYVRSSELVVIKPFVGTDGSSTNPFLVAGAYTPEGGLIDADGLLSISDISFVDAANDTVVGTGALVGKALAQDTHVRVALDGASSLTSGQAVLRVRYVAPNAAAAGVKTF